MVVLPVPVALGTTQVREFFNLAREANTEPSKKEVFEFANRLTQEFGLVL